MDKLIAIKNTQRLEQKQQTGQLQGDMALRHRTGQYGTSVSDWTIWYFSIGLETMALRYRTGQYGTFGIGDVSPKKSIHSSYKTQSSSL